MVFRLSLRTALLSLSRMNLYVCISCKCLCGGTIIWALSLIFCVRITRCRFPTDVLCFHNRKNSNMWTIVHLGQVSPVSDYSLISGRTCGTNIHWLPAMPTVPDSKSGVAEGPLIQRSLCVCRASLSWGSSTGNFLLSWRRSPLWCPPIGQLNWHYLYLIFLSMFSIVSGLYLTFTERRVQLLNCRTLISRPTSKRSFWKVVKGRAHCLICTTVTAVTLWKT